MVRNVQGSGKAIAERFPSRLYALKDVATGGRSHGHLVDLHESRVWAGAHGHVQIQRLILELELREVITLKREIKRPHQEEEPEEVEEARDTTAIVDEWEGEVKHEGECHAPINKDLNDWRQPVEEAHVETGKRAEPNGDQHEGQGAHVDVGHEVDRSRAERHEDLGKLREEHHGGQHDRRIKRELDHGDEDFGKTTQRSERKIFEDLESNLLLQLRGNVKVIFDIRDIGHLHVVQQVYSVGRVQLRQLDQKLLGIHVLLSW